jgi:hypothetical protein
MHERDATAAGVAATAFAKQASQGWHHCLLQLPEQHMQVPGDTPCDTRPFSCAVENSNRCSTTALFNINSIFISRHQSLCRQQQKCYSRYRIANAGSNMCAMQ